MNDITYTIVRKDSFNKFGERSYTSYYIRYRQYFLGLVPYWKYVKAWEYGLNSKIDFFDENAAKDFIKDILCKNKPYNKFITTPISEVKCKLIN